MMSYRKWMLLTVLTAVMFYMVPQQEAEAFDATFPPKEKAWMPSQEEFYIYSHSSVIR